MEKVIELLEKLNQSTAELSAVKTEFAMPDKTRDAVDEMLQISNVFSNLLKNFIDRHNEGDVISDDDKNKIQIINQHYKSVKNIVLEFSKQ